MTSDYDQITAFCARRRPALIYVAIGCAQGHNSPEYRSPQQFPPFIREGWPTGEVIAILIDPALEPDAELQGLADAAGDPEVAFLTVRREFYWTVPTDAAFIRSLCRLALYELHDTQMIVQDYTGDDISRHLFPFLQEFESRLQYRVLFDATYGRQGGCYIDFDAIQLLRDPYTGEFIQPQYLRLTDGIGHGAPVEHLRQTVTARIQTLRQYAHRVLRCLRNPVEERPVWCSDTVVIKNLEPVAFVYDIPLRTVTAARLTALLTRFAEDLRTIADADIPIAELIAAPTSDPLTNALYLLRDTALGIPHPH